MALGKLPDSGADEGDEGGESIFAEINITPLTDVFLVMVIIFMVSALAVQVERNQEKQKQSQNQQEVDKEKRSGLKVNLPQGAAQEIDTSKESLVLLVPITGDVQVGGKAMTESELDNIFRLAFQKDKNTQVVIKADTANQYGRVVKLMERAKAAGLTRLAIATSGG